MTLRFSVPPKKLAILRLSALGDCMLLIPTIRRIQQYWPDTEITWIIDKTFYPLFQCVNGVRFLPINKPRNGKDYCQLRKQLQTEQFDILLAMQASLRANLIYPAIKAPVKIGFDKQRARDLHGLFVNQRIPAAQEHLLDGFQRFADQLGIPPAAAEWRIRLPEDDLAWAHTQLLNEGAGMPSSPRWIALNPTASKPERTPYIDFYIRLIDEINKVYPHRVILTGGSVDWEIQMNQEIADQCYVKPLNLSGQTSLKQLAALLASVEVVIAPDTGPAHIANAFGTPVIGLYAVAPPLLSAPYLSKELVINKFPKAVKQFLNKDPNTLPWGTRVHDRRAMALFGIDEIKTKLDTLFRQHDRVSLHENISLAGRVQKEDQKI